MKQGPKGQARPLSSGVRVLVPDVPSQNKNPTPHLPSPNLFTIAQCNTFFLLIP